MVGVYRRGEDRERKGGKEGISLMFLAANQLRSQGYPGFANSHGKGGGLRAEWGGGLRWKRGGRDGCPFSPGGMLMHWGRVIFGALLSDKVGLGPGRRRKGALGSPRASSQTALPSARFAQEQNLNYYSSH